VVGEDLVGPAADRLIWGLVASLGFVLRAGNPSTVEVWIFWIHVAQGDPIRVGPAAVTGSAYRES